MDLIALIMGLLLVLSVMDRKFWAKITQPKRQGAGVRRMPRRAIPRRTPRRATNSFMPARGARATKSASAAPRWWWDLAA